MATPSHFQIINKNQFFEIKIEFRHRVGNAFERSKMRGPHHHIENLKIYLGKNYDMLTRLKSLVLAKVREHKKKNVC